MQSFYDVILSPFNTPVVGAQIFVYQTDGTLATLYSNNSGTPTTNPLISDANGGYLFYAANGLYYAIIVANGYENKTVSNIQLSGFNPYPRVYSVASAASVTPDVSLYDQYCFTALATGLTINAPVGVPGDGTRLLFRILDNGTARALTWDATFTAVGASIPTSTTANKTVYIGCIYNAAAARWDVVSVAQQV